MSGKDDDVYVDETPPWFTAKIDQALAQISEHNTPELVLALALNLVVVVNLDPIITNDEHQHGHPCAKCGTVMGCDDVPYDTDVLKQHSSGVVIMFVAMFCTACGDELAGEA